ncbi:hypothetical protein CRM22_008923 [Opisthorchis felineus]|uniref:Uncharacterized protein n=1 Tax=Opisthorchis felineus TaxID=147828 RepID=A0A4S2LG19_OPIFE|nr:hypothetical protein CRM22_008923 [Opisthorchis felineus]
MFQEIHQSARAPKMENNWSYVWAHGDFIELHSDTLGLTISGRSDATLNPSGIRFGSAEIYNLIESLSAISDSLCVAQSNRSRTDERVLLFVKPVDIAGGDTALPKELEDQIRNVIRSQLSPRFIPAIIQSVPEIPVGFSVYSSFPLMRQLLSSRSRDFRFFFLICCPSPIGCRFKLVKCWTKTNHCWLLPVTKFFTSVIP